MASGEIVVRIAGEQMCLWRAVDHEGEVLDILVRAGATPDPRGGELLAKRHCGRMTADLAVRPRQLCLAMPCGELRCSWPEIRFLRLSRAAERLHWNNLNADGPALGTSSCGRLGRVNSGHA